MKRSASSSGWVYILTNQAYPRLLKIGCTGRTPETRARELSTTGVPYPFAVAWAAPVTDYGRCESLVHARLDRLRANQGREFFACDLVTARRAIEDAAADLLRPWWWRLLFLRSPAKRPYGRRSRRGSADGLIVGVLFVALVGGITWLKPVPPSWLPPAVARMVLMLEKH